MNIINGKLATDAAARNDSPFVWFYDCVCGCCGEPFLSVSPAAKFVNHAHRQRAYEKRKFERQSEQRFMTAKGGAK